MSRGAIQNPLPMHEPTLPLRILGGDPGATAGVTFVEFRTRRRDGTPMWDGARLLGAVTIGKPSRKGASIAELDVLHRRRVFETLDDGESPIQNPGSAHIVALEEPLDGSKRYSDNPSQNQRGQGTGTAFRLGVHYAALLHGLVMATRGSARIVSFPAKTASGRKGWMRGGRTPREHTLAACDSILRSICTREQYDLLLRGEKQRAVPDHILMAIGVTNHVVEHFTDFFPRS